MNGSSGDQQFPTRLPENEARRILDRAMELDHATGPQMSLVNLRAIATELNISDEAIDSALRESFGQPQRDDAMLPPPRAEQSAQSGSKLSRWWGWRRESWSRGLRFLTRVALPLGAVAGVAAVAIGRSFHLDFVPLMMVFGVIGVASAALIAIRPRASTTVQTIAVTGLFWVGIMAGTYLAVGEDLLEILRVLTPFMAGAIALGIVSSGVLALVRHLSPDGAPPAGGSGSSPWNRRELRQPTSTRNDEYNLLAVGAK